MNKTEEGVVGAIWRKEDQSQPVAFGINPHVPVSFLYRDDPRFAESLAMLEESKLKRVPVRFCWARDTYGRRLTFVELKK